ncbi:hypothetical protein [Legionella nagasakiensis]|uniref:hypothetical protein n=1 Tax=Legionella nagasakiensis TaxID=535290 RepID=UPI0010558439|nr:hypothetical protein [Legionella nagasakiensis]
MQNPLATTFNLGGGERGLFNKDPIADKEDEEVAPTSTPADTKRPPATVRAPAVSPQKGAEHVPAFRHTSAATSYPLPIAHVEAKAKAEHFDDIIKNYNKKFLSSGKYSSGHEPPRIQEAKDGQKSATFKFSSLQSAIDFFLEQAQNQKLDGVQLKKDGQVIAVARDGKLYYPGPEGAEIKKGESFVMPSQVQPPQSSLKDRLAHPPVPTGKPEESEPSDTPAHQLS